MDRNRDLRRAPISTVSGLPRRRQRITTLRDSTDEDRQMELQETVRLRDRERLQKKDRDREFPKRRRVDRLAVQQRSGGGESYRENDSTDSSHDEYYEDEEEEETNIRQQNRLNQLSPTSSSLPNNRRGLRTLRSSPVLRAAVDEMLGVPIPRRARSSSAKRLHDYWNSGKSGFGEDSSHRRFSPHPATVSMIGSGSASPPPSGPSLKKRMKFVEPKSRGLSSPSNSRPSSVIQDDIEIEVAEALFDLMKQSQPESQSSQKQEKVDRDSTRTADDGLKRLKAEGGKDENNAFSVYNEQSIKVNAETVVADSVKEVKKEGRIEKEKFPDDTAQELLSGDGFVNKGKVGSPKENESSSFVKVNACDIQDLKVTKTANAEILVEAKKETRLEIDLMAPPLPSSPDRDTLVDMATEPKVLAQDVQKKSVNIRKNGPLPVSIHMQEQKVGVINGNQLPNLDMEKKYRHDIFSVSDSTSQQQKAPKEQKNQSSVVPPFPIGMSSWAGVLPHPGYIQAVLPIDGSARSSKTMLHPQFKFSKPCRKKCATHQHIAQNIHHHQQLIKKSLSSGPTASTTLCGTKSPNPKSMLPAQTFIPRNPFPGEFQERQNSTTISGGSVKDKTSNATTNEKSLLQQASHQAQANSFLHGPGFMFPLGQHHQTTMMAPANSSGQPVSKSSINLPLPGGASGMSFNHHPMFTSNEAASAPAYMAILQNSGGCPVPISTNIAMPSFKGGTPNMPFFNSPFYSSQVFNLPTASQSRSTFSQPQTSTKIKDNKVPTQVSQPEKQSKLDSEISRKTNNVQTCSSFPNNLIPQTFALSFGSNPSTVNFSTMAQNSAVFTSEGKFPSPSFNFSKSDFDSLNFLPSSLSGVQPIQSSSSASASASVSITIPNFQQQKNQMQNPNSPFLPQWENFARTTAQAQQGSSQSATSPLVNIPHITFSNNPSSSFQGQQQMTCLVGSPSVGKVNSSSVSALPSQENDNGSNQKSSPACRRNVPSILSTCPSQISEIKY